MGHLLRKIAKPKWYDQPWLLPGEVPSDALTDLRSDNNEISVWAVDADKSNLEAVLSALAADRHEIDKLDYVLFDDSILATLGITFRQTEGDSPHKLANTQWHRDLVELTADKVARLARELKKIEGQHTRVGAKPIRALLITALQSGVLQREGMHPKLLEQLEPNSAKAQSPARTPGIGAAAAPPTAEGDHRPEPAVLQNSLMRWLRSIGSRYINWWHGA